MAEVKNILDFEGIKHLSTYLVLISPEKIPHLIIVKEKKYYSLTYKKAVIAEDFESYLKFLKKSGKKVLFLEIEDGTGDLYEKYRAYSSAESGKFTCLQPIKDWLAPVTNIEFVFELIPFLYAEEKIGNAYQIGMAELIDSNACFQLRDYKKEDIYSYIEELNKKYV